MKTHFKTALRMTLATTVLLGLVYPLVITGIAQALFPQQANGQLIKRDGKPVGSRLIGQPFSSPQYFYSRPSAAGVAGYDATASGGANLGPTNRRLLERVAAAGDRVRADDPGEPIPIDLVTTSASGLDPHLSPEAADIQVRRVARVRGCSESIVRGLLRQHYEPRQLGVLGEPRVSLLELNLDLDRHCPLHLEDGKAKPSRGAGGRQVFP